MRQVYITTGFPIIIGYYCCIEARTRKKRTEREENCPRIFRATNTYTHYSSSIRCWFFLSFQYVYAKKDQKKRYCLFFSSLYMFFGIIELVYLLFLSSIRERKREKTEEFPKQHNSYRCCLCGRVGI